VNKEIENKINLIKDLIINKKDLSRFLFLKEKINKDKYLINLKNKMLYYKDKDNKEYIKLKEEYKDNIYISEFNNLNSYIKESLFQIKLIIEKELNIYE